MVRELPLMWMSKSFGSKPGASVRTTISLSPAQGTGGEECPAGSLALLGGKSAGQHSRPRPTPSATHVPAIRAMVGSVTSLFHDKLLLFGTQARAAPAKRAPAPRSTTGSSPVEDSVSGRRHT